MILYQKQHFNRNMFFLLLKIQECFIYPQNNYFIFLKKIERNIVFGSEEIRDKRFRSINVWERRFVYCIFLFYFFSIFAIFLFFVSSFFPYVPILAALKHSPSKRKSLSKVAAQRSTESEADSHGK